MCNNERKPHVHAELIKAWADGAVIQYFDKTAKCWYDTGDNQPFWSPDEKYRIKPEQSDFEKYGIEKGDVWHNYLGCPFFVAEVVSPASFRCLDKHKYRMGVLVTLVFRRGVVDKL